MLAISISAVVMFNLVDLVLVACLEVVWYAQITYSESWIDYLNIEKKLSEIDWSFHVDVDVDIDIRSCYSKNVPYWCHLLHNLALFGHLHFIWLIWWSHLIGEPTPYDWYFNCAWRISQLYVIDMMEESYRILSLMQYNNNYNESYILVTITQ